MEEPHVRFGSQADMCGATSHVRFAPNSDRESGLPQPVMSALPPKADMCGATRDIRYGPKADMKSFCPCASICSLSLQHIVSRQRAANALECKIADRLDRYVLLNCHQDTGAN